MAKKKDTPSKSLEDLNKQVQDIHKITYNTNVDNDTIKSSVYDDLSNAIKNAVQADSEYKNMSATSTLFRKFLGGEDGSKASSTISKQLGTGSNEDISSLFQQPQILNSLMDTYSKTKWVQELDKEFDLICKYMPKLQVALDIKKDAVLCADTYSKKYLNISPKGIDPNSDRYALVQRNITDMITRYRIYDNCEKWYDDASKYGEEFVYCVPYSVALEELLKKKKSATYSPVSESTITDKDFDQRLKAEVRAFQSDSGVSIKVRFDSSNILTEAIENNLYLKNHSNKFRGLSESFVIHETKEDFKSHVYKDGKNTEIKFDSTIGDEIEWEDEDRTASNGLFGDQKESERKINVNGAVLKTIKHFMVLPIYIEDVMFGCYYVKAYHNNLIDNTSSGGLKSYNTMSGMFSSAPSATSSANVDQTRRENDMFLRQISSIISQKIDKAFINSNTDLKEEIYLLLKYNDTFNRISDNGLDFDVVFIPADDIHHLKFTEDPDTHRGISDLWDALVPAKLWITMNLTSVLGWTTRGFDRRVYYVKQSLDTNTAQSLLNVVSSIKKGNFGVRQMESVNNILNIVGRFNDFVIPMGPNGDPPIQFDTQPGQDFNFPEELLSKAEEDAVNSTDVPLEIVNSSAGMDFAVRYTMTNAKLLRNVLKRQLKMSEFLSEVLTKIYKFEYEENVDIEVTLPPPAFLSMTQGQQLLSSAMQLADVYTEVEMSNRPDNEKAIFKKSIVRKMMPSYLSEDEIQELKNNIIISKENEEDSMYGEE